MELKAWMLFLMLIFSDGIIIFILQKIFEKREIIRTIKFEYVSILKQKVDLSLELHAKAIRLCNEGNETIQQYVNSTSDVYYYYVQNKIMFEALNSNMEHIAVLILELAKAVIKKR